MKIKLKIKIVGIAITTLISIILGMSLITAPSFSYTTYWGALLNSARIFIGVFLLFGAGYFGTFKVLKTYDKLKEVSEDED